MPFPCDERNTNKDAFIGGQLCWTDLWMRRPDHLLQGTQWPGVTEVWHNLCVRWRAGCKKDLYLVSWAHLRVLVTPLRHYTNQGNSSLRALSTSVPEPNVQGCADPTLSCQGTDSQKDGAGNVILKPLSWVQQESRRIRAETGGLDETEDWMPRGYRWKEPEKGMSRQREHTISYIVGMGTVLLRVVQ